MRAPFVVSLILIFVPVLSQAGGPQSSANFDAQGAVRTKITALENAWNQAEERRIQARWILCWQAPSLTSITTVRS